MLRGLRLESFDSDVREPGTPVRFASWGDSLKNLLTEPRPD